MWRHQIRCSDSKFPGHRSDHSSPPPSPVTRLAFLRRAPRLRDRAWRSVACYRSGTVAGSHGIPSILRRKAKAFGARTKIQRTSRTLTSPRIPSIEVLFVRPTLLSSCSGRSKAGRLTHVGQPSRLAPGAVVVGAGSDIKYSVPTDSRASTVNLSPKKTNVRRGFTLPGQSCSGRSKAGRLTYVGQPSRLAPGAVVVGSRARYQIFSINWFKYLNSQPVPKKTNVRRGSTLPKTKLRRKK
jgi:hypothetical protein